MKMLTLAAVAAAILATANPAQASGIGAEAGYAQVDGVNGGEVGLGYGYDIGPLRVASVAGAYIYQGDPNRYFLQTQLNNSTACIDSTTNMLARLMHCNDLTAQPYGKLEATLGIPTIGRLGGGYRLSDYSTPYGTIVFTALPIVDIRASVGNDYYALGLSIGF